MQYWGIVTSFAHMPLAREVHGKYAIQLPDVVVVDSMSVLVFSKTVQIINVFPCFVILLLLKLQLGRIPLGRMTFCTEMQMCRLERSAVPVNTEEESKSSDSLFTA